MAQFTSELHSFRPQFPFLEVDHPDMAHLNQLSEISQSILENQNQNPTSTLHNSSSIMVPVITGDYFFTNQGPEFSMSVVGGGGGGNFHQANHGFFPNNINISQCEEFFESNKRKAMDVSETSSLNSSPQVSGTDQLKKKTNSRRGKRVKSSEVDEKPHEVVHVRARRGQATDSHSLAERVRRGKINEKLSCLQDIVPGCYKSMGMAVMLDEIINYVQSLQNQVEFLSMKLTAASTFYDFNSEADDIEAMRRAKAQEAIESERMTREGYGEVPINCFHSPSTWTL